MNIKILRVLSIGSKESAILAKVDGFRVTWAPHRPGGSLKPWSCDCLTELDKYECEHIVAVRELIDYRVFQPLSPFEDNKMVVLK